MATFAVHFTSFVLCVSDRETNGISVWGFCCLQLDFVCLFVDKSAMASFIIVAGKFVLLAFASTAPIILFERGRVCRGVRVVCCCVQIVMLALINANGCIWQFYVLRHHGSVECL